MHDDRPMQTIGIEASKQCTRDRRCIGFEGEAAQAQLRHRRLTMSNFLRRECRDHITQCTERQVDFRGLFQLCSFSARLGLTLYITRETQAEERVSDQWRARERGSSARLLSFPPSVRSLSGASVFVYAFGVRFSPLT